MVWFLLELIGEERWSLQRIHLECFKAWPFPLYFSYHMKLQDEVIYGRGPQLDCTAGGEQWASETVNVWDDPSPPPGPWKKLSGKRKRLGTVDLWGCMSSIYKLYSALLLYSRQSRRCSQSLDLVLSLSEGLDGIEQSQMLRSKME